MIHRAVFKYGRGESEYEFTKDGNRWKHRKAGEEKWKSSTSVWAGKFERHLAGDNGQLTLFDTPRRVTIKDVMAEVEEIKRTLMPADDSSMPTSADLSEEKVVRPILYDLNRLGPHPKYRVIDRDHVKGRGRHYVVQFEGPDGKWSAPEFYVGVTSIGDAMLVPPKERIEWMMSFGSMERYEEEMTFLADKGTMMHTALAHAAMGMLPEFGTYEWEKYVKGMMARHFMDMKRFHEIDIFLRKSILSFKQWVHDHRVTFLAIEIPLGIPHTKDANGHKVFGYFGQLDFIVEMDLEPWVSSKKPPKANLPKKPYVTKKGEQQIEWIMPNKSKDWEAGEPHSMARWDSSGVLPRAGEGSPKFPAPASVAPGDPAPADRFRPQKGVVHYLPYPDWRPSEPPPRVIAIVDAKSGKHDHEEHDVQLGLQIPLLHHNFPKLRGEKVRVYNWHPIDWKEESAVSKGYFPYNLIDKTDRMDDWHTNWILEGWRRKQARELPSRLLWSGDANLGTSPAENVQQVTYPDYYTRLVARAKRNKWIDYEE